VTAGQSVLVIGEAGSGLDEFAQAIYRWFAGDLNCAIATYKASGKKFFQGVAEQLNIPTTETRFDRNGEPTGEKDLTMDALKDEIADNTNDQTLLILPEAKRLTTGIRYWLEDLISNGVRVVCFAAANPGKDIFLSMLEVELSLPSDREIREVMTAEAKRQGVSLSSSRLAELQPLAGRNPMLARKVIRSEKLGLNRKADPQHTQYVVIMPILIAALFSFAVIRFIGMGTGNKGMYIMGGTAFVSAMALKQLGQVRGARKRLGQ